MLLNYFVDPYILYGSQRIEGFNKIKPKAGTHSKQSKIHLARNSDINTLIVGNSRPEMGLDPEHKYFQRNGLNVFNFGQPGSSLSVQYGYALDILREKKNIKTVLISVDFIDFLTREKPVDPYVWPPKNHSDDRRKKYNWDGSSNTDYSIQYMKDIYVPLIALGTLQDSLLTISGQRETASNLRNDGFNTGNDMRAATLSEGVKMLFSQKMPMLVKSFSSRPLKTYSVGTQWSPSFNKLSFLLKYLQNHNIQTKIFINPYHMVYLQTIDHSGLTDEFSIWKSQLIKMVSKISTDRNITLWNFSDPHSYISEPFLNRGNKPLHWFWEPAHYKTELGDIMINVMFSGSKKEILNHENFGYMLTPENIDGYIEKYTENLQKWQALNPKEKKYVTSFFK